MLDYLGVPYIQSDGEAEAMCAALNKHQVQSTFMYSIVSDQEIIVFAVSDQEIIVFAGMETFAKESK